MYPNIPLNPRAKIIVSGKAFLVIYYSDTKPKTALGNSGNQTMKELVKGSVSKPNLPRIKLVDSLEDINSPSVPKNMQILNQYISPVSMTSR